MGSGTRDRYRAALAVLVLGIALVGCRGRGGEAPLDSPTAGSITIAADESFKPLVEAEIDVFDSIYARAHIDALYKPEDEAIQDLLDGKVRLVVVSRGLTEVETKYFEREKIRPRSLKIAEDGVAFILNRQNPDSMLTMRQLYQIFDGDVKKWSDLRPGAQQQDIVVVFDNDRSSNLNFILRKFEVEDVTRLAIYAARSNAEVIEYVKTHENAMGVIGTAWISDSDDPAQQSFLDGITVMSIADVADPTPGDYYQPYQAYLATKDYPLWREVLILSREARAGLGTGFMSHIAGHDGQLIVLKSGLLPATMPVRLVGIRDDFRGE